jgi:hypothetical protein
MKVLSHPSKHDGIAYPKEPDDLDQLLIGAKVDSFKTIAAGNNICQEKR